VTRSRKEIEAEVEKERKLRIQPRKSTESKPQRKRASQ
jgi:hypothetical protein